MKTNKYLLGISVLIIALGGRTFAVTSSSSSYQVNESAFSSGSGINSNSASYNARGSAGDLGVGEAGSTNYSAYAGPISPSEEYLELNVTGATVNLGTLNTTTTGIGSSTFYVRTYINGSYVVKTMSPTPTNGTRSLAAMSTAAASSQGTEQFGINLVANTSPTNGSFPAGVGANPSLQPNSNFANGIAATGYDTANTYKYVIGDTIAQSGPTGKAWGQTNFTISYIANVNAVTTGGLFSVDHDIVLLATF